MDPSAYVDECAAQFVYTQANTRSTTAATETGHDTTATLLYALTDHNANLIALTDSQGHVAAQYSYTVYGEPLHGPNGLGGAEYASTAQGATTFGSLASAEAVQAARGNRIGHQGLRAERFDRPWDSPLDPSSASAAGTGDYRITYHNRNRIYEPAEGRFLSQDPNGLGLPVLGSLGHGGAAIGAWHVTADIMGHFSDGMSTHSAYGSRPLHLRDPNGLSLLGMNRDSFGDMNPTRWDPFDIVDDYLVHDVGSKAAFLERVIGGTHTAAYVGSWVASFVPGPIGVAAGFANGLMGVPDSLQGTMALRAMTAVEYISLAGAARGMLSRIAGYAVRTATEYGVTHGTRTAVGAVAHSGGLLSRAATWAGDHHLIPMYLAGARGGTRVALSHAEHVDLHRLIDHYGSVHGIPKRSQGADAVRGWVRVNGALGKSQMQDALINAYLAFDEKYPGKNMFFQLLEEFKRQPTW